MAHINKTSSSSSAGATERPSCDPAGRLVSLFTASGEDACSYDLAIKLGRKAASLGETVLILDAVDGKLMDRAGIVYARTLDDVAAGKAEPRDALYVTSNEHFTAGAVGPQGLEKALGLLAALSLSYDWLFVVPKAGCEPAHVRLGNASDVSVLSYSTQGDKFMRAFWMLDALRRPRPQFDPLILSSGQKCDAVETALMLTKSVREHLGAPPPYAGHMDDLHLETRLLKQMRVRATRRAVA